MHKYTILIPSYNDWECLNLLIPSINETLESLNEDVSILIINDASTIKNNLSFKNLNNLKKIEIINLKKNVRAQKAVATGLHYLQQIKFQGGVIVMDADGQDDPNDIKKIIKQSKNNLEKTILVYRLRRADSLAFKMFYQFFLIITLIFTFKYMRFGAFSYLHSKSFDKILSTNDVKLAYPAALEKHFKERDKIYANKKKRLAGNSKNNYLSLAHYGLKIISVFRFQVIFNSIIIFFVLLLAYNLFISSKLLLFLLVCIFLFNILIFLIHNKADKENYNDLKDNIQNLDNLKN